MEAPGTLHPLVCTPGPHRTHSPRYGPFSCFDPQRPSWASRDWAIVEGPGGPGDGGSQGLPFGPPCLSFDSPTFLRYFGKIDFFDPGSRKSVKSARASPWETVRVVGFERRPTPPRRAAATPDPGHRVGRPPKRGGPAPCPDPTAHPVLGKSLHYYLLLLLVVVACCSSSCTFSVTLFFSGSTPWVRRWAGGRGGTPPISGWCSPKNRVPGRGGTA